RHVEGLGRVARADLGQRLARLVDVGDAGRDADELGDQSAGPADLLGTGGVEVEGAIASIAEEDGRSEQLLQLRGREIDRRDHGATSGTTSYVQPSRQH